MDGVGRAIAKEKKLDLNDALQLIILGRCNGKPLAAMQQECGRIAEIFTVLGMMR
jgi:hypothetical protein